MKKRIVYFDLLKAFAIFLVIWGHAIKHLMDVDSHGVVAFNVIYSFHMPLFMTIVGFFAASSLKSHPWEFLKHKFKQLLLPAFVWITIFTLLAFVLLPPMYHVAGITEYVKNMIFQLWFLKSAFFCYLIFYIPQWLLGKFKLSHRMFWGLLISLIVSQAFPLMKVNAMFIPFLAGVVINRYQPLIYKNWILFFITGIALYVIMYFTTDCGLHLKEMSAIKSDLLHGNLYALKDLAENQIVHIALGVSATVALVALFYGLFKAAGNNAWVSYLSEAGRSTLGIYILQTFILEQVMLAYVNIQGISNIAASMVVCPLISFVILDLSLSIIRLIRRNETTSYWLLGVSKSKTIIK